MARPQTKQALITAAENNFARLWTLIDSFTAVEADTAFDFTNQPNLKGAHWARDKNVRDVLTHLYEWHQLLIEWVERNQTGESVKFLPEPYTFQTIAGLNQTFWHKHQQTSDAQARKLLRQSHVEVMRVIESFSDEELFAKQHFPWTGTTSLGSYCVSATSSHYDWAIKKLNKHRRNLR